jgi:tRNA(Ile)-lysidine synthetase-like protein
LQEERDTESLRPPRAASDGLAARLAARLAALDAGWAGRRYVLGYSGGCDSTALAALLSRLLPGGTLLAATLDHGIREGSAAEAAAAAAAAESMGLETLVRRADVPAEARSRGKGLEEAGRAARYMFLREAKVRFGADWILTAHQADDSAETVLLKIARGAGPGALQGIPLRSGDVLRPLLQFSRAELASFLASQGIGWTEDPSNRDPRFTRNLVRERILPLFLEMNPRFLEALGRGALITADEEGFWLKRLEELEARLVRPCPPPARPGDDGPDGNAPGVNPAGKGPSAKEPSGKGAAAAPASGKARRPAAGPGPAAGGPFSAEGPWPRHRSPQSPQAGSGGGPPEPEGLGPPGPDGLGPPELEGRPCRDGGPVLIDREGLLRLHPAEQRRLLGRLIRQVRLPGASGGEPPQLSGVEAAMAFAASEGRGGADLPSGRRIERRGGELYLGPASRYGPSWGGRRF